KGTLPLHQCVGYTDMALQRFFEAAKKEAWYERTVFVITADHSVPSHYEAYKTNINGYAVPIVFHAPGLQLKGLDASLAQQIDILPTVMELLNYPGSYVAFGNNLLDEEGRSDRFVLSCVSDNFPFL